MVENDLFDDLVDEIPVDGNDQPADQTVEPAQENPTVDVSDENAVEPTNEFPEDDLITSYLRSRGLKDGKTIVYENEDGTNEEIDFHTLEKEEQLNILNELAKSNLTEDEIRTIDYLRSQNASLQDVINYYSQKAVENYIAQNGAIEPVYQVDDYSDDELYVADLRSKYEMTDEELAADLEIAKSNGELFKKKVEVIRKQYKDAEDQRIEDGRRAQEEKYTNFTNNVYDALNNFNELSLDYRDKESDSLQIEDAEKEAVYNYILSRDENGATQFFKDLNDPKVLVELAWYRLYGQDAISGISQYWKSVLKESRKQQTPTKQTRTTVVPTREDPKKKSEKSISSLWSDE